MATAKPKALIVGGGISGLSLAWWLDKAGWTSTIIERASEPRGGGYVVSISGLGLEAVRHMGLYDKLEAVSYKFEENVIKDNRGRELLRLWYKDVHGGIDALAICRDDLARVLTDALPETATIRHGATVKDIVEKENKITAALASGEDIEADLLVGADGLRSAIPVYDAEGDIKLESDCVSFNALGHLDVLYTLRNNRVAALHIWQECGSTPKERHVRFAQVRSITNSSTKLVTDVLGVAEEAGCVPLIDSLTMVNLPKWSKGRMLLFGDSAHCLTLMSGQGAGMALASAEILGKELKSNTDVSQALLQHEKKLRPIVERLQGRSRNMAAMYIPKNAIMYHLRNIVLRIVPYSWIVLWHASSTKAELDLMKN